MATRASDRQLATRHRYRLHDGRLAVSVTKVTSFADAGKARAFAFTARNLQRQGIDFDALWRDRANDGSRRHGLMETWLEGVPIIDADRHDEPFLDALAAFIIECGVEMVAQECILLSDTHGYGGRCDLICWLTHPDTGERLLWLIDLKTGKPQLVEHALQLCAYRHADGIAVYEDDGTLAPGFAPLPDIQRTGALYVNIDGATLVETPCDQDVFDTFLALLEATRTHEALVKRLRPERTKR
jgi:hypothetical protein